jgi:hypothetical protein
MVADNTRKPRQHYSAAVIAKCKALYVVKGLSPKDVVQRTGVSLEALGNWTQRYGWTAEKRARLTRLEKNAVTRAEDSNAGFLESMGTQAEEIAEDAMQMSREYAVARDPFAAKNLQSATQSVKNMVDVYFKARGLDGKNGGNSVVNIGSVYVNNAPLQRDAKPALDLGKVQLSEGSA